MGTSEPTDDSPRSGVIGLGMIGGGVAVSLANRGRVPVVHDVRRDAADLPGEPEAVASPVEVAERCDIVLIAVVTAEQVREVLTGPRGVLCAARPDLTVVLLSTVDTDALREFAAACTDAGVGFLDCGVTPGDKAADNGLLTLVGGPAETVQHARPVLEDFARAVVHCGGVGAGMATKLARNVVTYGSWRAVAEALSLAGAAGVDRDSFLRAITAADPDGSTLLQMTRLQGIDEAAAAEFAEHIGPLMGRGLDGPQAKAAIDELIRGVEPLMRKDLAAAQALAAALGVDLPLVEVTKQQAGNTLGLDEEQA